MKRIGLIALLIAVLAAGCGDKKPEDPAAKGLTPEEAVKQAEAATGTSLGTTTTVQGQAGGNTTTTTASKSGGQPGANTGTTAPPDPSVKMSVERTCVRRGATGDSQVLVVSGTTAGDTIAWSTQYSDGSNEMSKPEYKTGSGYGKADDKGNFRTEWKIPPTAPLGEATLHTIAKGNFGPKLTFRVVDEDGKC